MGEKGGVRVLSTPHPRVDPPHRQAQHQRRRFGRGEGWRCPGLCCCGTYGWTVKGVGVPPKPAGVPQNRGVSPTYPLRMASWISSQMGGSYGEKITGVCGVEMGVHPLFGGNPALGGCRMRAGTGKGGHLTRRGKKKTSFHVGLASGGITRVQSCIGQSHEPPPSRIWCVPPPFLPSTHRPAGKGDPHRRRHEAPLAASR